MVGSCFSSVELDDEVRTFIELSGLLIIYSIIESIVDAIEEAIGMFCNGS